MSVALRSFCKGCFRDLGGVGIPVNVRFGPVVYALLRPFREYAATDLTVAECPN